MMNDSEKSFVARPMTWAAGLIILAVIGTLIWLLLNNSRDEKSSAVSQAPSASAAPSSDASSSEAPTPAPSATDTLPTDSTYDSACGLNGGLTTMPTTTAPTIEWESVLDGLTYLPISAEHGPGNHSGDGAWTCFARTPMGAAIAAYTISMRVDGVASNFEDALTRGTMPGVGQTTKADQGPGGSGGYEVIPKGFVIDRYTNDEATITYYLSSPAMDTTCSMEVVWDQTVTDWRLRLASNGQTVLGCIQGPPSRFIPWGP